MHTWKVSFCLSCLVVYSTYQCQTIIWIILLKVVQLMVPKVDLISSAELLFLAQHEHHCSFHISKPKIYHNDCSSRSISTDENNVHTNTVTWLNTFYYRKWNCQLWKPKANCWNTSLCLCTLLPVCPANRLCTRMETKFQHKRLFCAL